MSAGLEVTTQKEIRNRFWGPPSVGVEHRGWKQNQYPVDVRLDFCDFVEYLHRSGEISSALANRATL